jgi:sirohydrochlorin ferrochelatase
MTVRLLIAHGSPDPRHRETMHLVAKGLAARGPHCEAAFLEHDEPRVEDSLAACAPGARVVTLGMLLAPGYHATVDVPRLLATAPASVTVIDRGPMGTGPWLHPALEWLVDDVGGRPSTPVVLAVAGSTRPDARRSLDDFAAQWQRTRPGQVHLAAATGPGRSLEDALTGAATVGEPPVVLPLMIAPGVLADRARKVATSRGLLTTGTLAEAPQFVDAVTDRLGT